MSSNRDTIVIKYGGAAMNDAATAKVLLQEIASRAAAGNRIIVVHGGGPEIDRALKRLNIEPKKVAGLRVTDAETMEIVEMVLAGKVNKSLVSTLCQCGANAVGLSGRDNTLLLADKKEIEGIDLGSVGTVTKVSTELLEVLLNNGFLPVLCSIASDEEGTALNINADEAAAAIAVAIEAKQLVLLTDVPGVMTNYPDPKSVVPVLGLNEIERLITEGKIDKGMLPKVNACTTAVREGVLSAVIGDGRSAVALQSIINGDGTNGTVIKP